MSNARSPREVCSTTIGMFGLIGFSLLLAAGGPQLFRRLLRLLLLFLLGSPNRLASFRLSGRDRLDVGGDPVDRLLEAQVGADAVCAAPRNELFDVLVALVLLS